MDNYRSVFESRISGRGYRKVVRNKKPLGNLMPRQYLHGHVTWKVMQRNAWTDSANLRMKPLSNYNKLQRYALMIIKLKKKMDQLKKYLLSAHELF